MVHPEPKSVLLSSLGMRCYRMYRIFIEIFIFLEGLGHPPVIREAHWLTYLSHLHQTMSTEGFSDHLFKSRPPASYALAEKNVYYFYSLYHSLPLPCLFISFICLRAAPPPLFQTGLAQGILGTILFERTTGQDLQ